MYISTPACSYTGLCSPVGAAVPREQCSLWTLTAAGNEGPAIALLHTHWACVKILPLCETPEVLCGLENASRASTDTAVGRKQGELYVLAEPCL